jgi:glycosyltransferase involved in cell wall biosynthesis
MDHAARCSIVIRAFNEEKHIGRLLTGILQQTRPPAEIVLVDSGSTDATLSIAARFPVRIVSVRPEEFSFGRSLNRGISQTSGDLVVLASAHVYPVYADWLEQLLRPLDDAQVALSYGQQRGYEGTRFSEHQVFAKWFPERSEPRQGHPFCNNANAAIRRELWEIHPYDETLSGLEDVAWASWAMQHGRAVTYVAEAPVIHVHEETPRLIYNRYRREAMALRTIRPGERFHLWDFARLFASNVASDMAHAFRQKSLLREARGILSFRWMQFWGTYRGFSHAGPLSGSLKQVFYYPSEAAGAAARPARQATRVDYSAHGGEVGERD